MKKNQIKMMLVAGLVVLAAACEKQPVNSEIVSGNVVTIKASVEGSGTKAKIAESDAKFSWTAGDQISVHTSTGYKDSEALTAGGSASADFTFTSLSDEGRTGFAVYPASIKNTTYYSSTDFRVNLPTEYNINLSAAGYEEIVPIPMVAKNAPGTDLSFKHVCSLIRLTLLKVPVGTRTILVLCDKNIAGSCQVSGATSDPFEPYIAYNQGTATGINFRLAADLTEETDIVLNIPVPTGVYSADQFYVTAKNGSGTEIRGYSFFGPTVSLARAKGKKMAATAFPFSVSSVKKVAFAPGNLQATTNDNGANWTWSFATDQRNYKGASANGNRDINGYGTTSESTCTVDLFGWKTDATNNSNGINSYTAATLYDGSFVDWGTLSIGGYAANTWSTLTSAEWQYVLMTRTTTTLNGVENARFFKARIASSDRGLILFPDNYVHPAGVDLPPASSINAPTQGYVDYLSTDWNKMEAAGCVFLPAAGHRYTSAGVVKVDDANEIGTYWSSSKTLNSTQALAASFSESALSYLAIPNRSDGYAVRLVRVVQ